MMGCCGFGGFGGFGSFGLVGGILNLVVTIGLIVGVILLVVWAVRRLSAETRGSEATRGEPSPQEILQARYARGELDREQYQQMLADLQ
jgi:putative membrane protein